MLVTKLEEISRFLPGNMISSIVMLESFISQSETAFVRPVLGEPLYNELCERYQAGTCTEEWKKLLDAVQYPLVNHAFHRAIPKLNVAFTAGGGAQVMVSGQAEIASKDRVEGLRRSVLADAHEGIDQLLLLLEADARSTTPVFDELWQKSEYYFRYEGSLFSTADAFDRCVSINGSRERFVQLRPEIELAEQMYIRPTLTDELTDALIEAGASRGDGDEARPAYLTLLVVVRRALALYVAYRDSELRRDTYQNDANTLLNDAMKRVRANPDRYPAYKESEAYRAELAEKQAAESAAAKGDAPAEAGWQNGTKKRHFVMG